MFFIWRLKAYDLALISHWTCYVLLFICIYFSHDGRILTNKLKLGLTQKAYVFKAIIIFMISFTISMIIVYFLGTSSKPLYYIWQPYTDFGIAIWFFGYVFIQPFIDNIIYHKWLVNIDNPLPTKYQIIMVSFIRTYVETGVLILDKNIPVDDGGLLSMALWIPFAISGLTYFNTKDESLSFVVDMLFRLATFAVVLLGMSNIIFFISF